MSILHLQLALIVKNELYYPQFIVMHPTQCPKSLLPTIFNYFVEAHYIEIILIGIDGDGNLFLVGISSDANQERISESQPQPTQDVREEEEWLRQSHGTIGHMMYIISTVDRSHSLQ